MSLNLRRLFSPKSIAVIGGGKWCKNVLRNCQEIGYSGDLWSVHPNRDSVAGIRAYPNVTDLPGAPEACFIGVNRNATIDVVENLSTKQAGGAICYANGFLEASGEADSGAELQNQLLDAAREMPLIGPNCYGFVNYLDGALLWPDQHGGKRVDAGVAIVTQSSNIAINLTMQRRGLPIAYVVTAGNQAQIGFAEIGAALLADDRVTALGLHIEGIGNITELNALSDTARALGKSVVALKVGRSDQAQAATLSHTASLAGSDAGAAALFDRLRIAQVESLPEFLEALKFQHVVGPLRTGKIASMSCSGGEASLMADAAVGHRVNFPELNEMQTKGLRKVLGPMVKLANPLDYNTHIWPDTSKLSATFTAMMDPGLSLGLVVLDFPRTDRCDASDWDNVIDAVSTTRVSTGQPMGIVTSLSENMPEDIAIRLIELGIAPLCGLSEAIKAVEIATQLGQTREKQELPLLPLQPKNVTLQSEAFAKAAIAEFGVPVPKNKVVASPEQATRAARSIGFPVALKGTGIAHKTEMAAVILNLLSEDDVSSAVKKMAVEGFLVEEMIGDSVCELLVGVVLDPAHGYVLTLAAGGVLTELMQDSVSLLIPTSADAVEISLRNLRVFPLLDGYRGATRANIGAIVQAVMAVQTYTCAHHGYIQEIEINPLICGQHRAVAADALVRAGERND